MPYPSEPTKILLKNNYYPSGLSAKEIYEYYTNDKIKKLILNESNSRPILLFLKFDESDKFVIKRKLENAPIVLNKNNYEEIISGYNISLSVETSYFSDRVKEIVLDLDSVGRKHISQKLYFRCITDIQNTFPNNNIRITNSSNGFHLRILLDKLMNRNKILDYVTETLTNSDLKNFYLINGKNLTSSNKDINIDLISMQYRGSSTIPYALCRNGLVSKDITNYLNLNMFNRKECVIDRFLKEI